MPYDENEYVPFKSIHVYYMCIVLTLVAGTPVAQVLDYVAKDSCEPRVADALVR